MEQIRIFFDGGKMPCILVENKADLLDKDELIIFKNWKNLQNIMDMMAFLELRLKVD